MACTFIGDRDDPASKITQGSEIVASPIYDLAFAHLSYQQGQVMKRLAKLVTM